MQYILENGKPAASFHDAVNATHLDWRASSTSALNTVTFISTAVFIAMVAVIGGLTFLVLAPLLVVVDRAQYENLGPFFKCE